MAGGGAQDTALACDLTARVESCDTPPVPWVLSARAPPPGPPCVDSSSPAGQALLPLPVSTTRPSTHSRTSEGPQLGTQACADLPTVARGSLAGELKVSARRTDCGGGTGIPRADKHGSPALRRDLVGLPCGVGGRTPLPLGVGGGRVCSPDSLAPQSPCLEGVIRQHPSLWFMESQTCVWPRSLLL